MDIMLHASKNLPNVAIQKPWWGEETFSAQLHQKQPQVKTAYDTNYSLE